MSSSDFVSGLGMLVVDHRLRRIVDQLLAAQADVYAQEAFPFEPRWASTFLLLEREGALPVTASGIVAACRNEEERERGPVN
jgi:hypothetical protein